MLARGIYSTATTDPRYLDILDSVSMTGRVQLEKRSHIRQSSPNSNPEKTLLIQTFVLDSYVLYNIMKAISILKNL